MHPTVMDFAARHLAGQEGKSFVEIGSLYVNGSVRDLAKEPSEYVGVDMIAGDGVDVVCKAEDYSPGRQFDWVLSTSTLEHCEDWRTVVNKIKDLCKPGGKILVTTHAPGMFRHNFPNDYWRWTMQQAVLMFSDFQMIEIEQDMFHPGWMLVATKGPDWKPRDLSDIEPSPAPCE